MLITQIHYYFALKMNNFLQSYDRFNIKVAKETELRHKTQIAYRVLLYKMDNNATRTI